MTAGEWTSILQDYGAIYVHEPNGWSMRGAPLLLAAVALASGLLLCEGALSIWHPQIHRRPPNIWQFDAELGWSHVPGGQGRLVTPEFDVGIEINRDGLRSPAYERQKREGVRRVLVFGDSFAEGWGVEGDEMLSARLQDCLSDSGEAAEVLNFGVAGYGTDQAYLLFQKLGQSYQPNPCSTRFSCQFCSSICTIDGAYVTRNSAPERRTARSKSRSSIPVNSHTCCHCPSASTPYSPS